MRSLPLPLAPDCLTSIAAARPNGPWFDGSNREEKIARRWLRRKLLKNQESICAWCQQKITLSSSHTDHIYPKNNSAYCALTFAINNLIACCGKSTSQTCGHKKGGHVLASWIHPYQTSHLEENFVYEIDGKMVHHSSLSGNPKSEALEAVDRVLNLNQSALKSKREGLIDDILNNPDFQDLSSGEIFLIVGEFKSLIAQYAY